MRSEKLINVRFAVTDDASLCFLFLNSFWMVWGLNELVYFFLNNMEFCIASPFFYCNCSLASGCS